MRCDDGLPSAGCGEVESLRVAVSPFAAQNLGGPGWFKDVLEVKIVYLSDKSGVPSGSGASEAEPCEVRRTFTAFYSNAVAPPHCALRLRFRRCSRRRSPSQAISSSLRRQSARSGTTASLPSWTLPCVSSLPAPRVWLSRGVAWRRASHVLPALCPVQLVSSPFRRAACSRKRCKWPRRATSRACGLCGVLHGQLSRRHLFWRRALVLQRLCHNSVSI
jgi:hypothetical protein